MTCTVTCTVTVPVPRLIREHVYTCYPNTPLPNEQTSLRESGSLLRAVRSAELIKPDANEPNLQQGCYILMTAHQG